MFVHVCVGRCSAGGGGGGGLGVEVDRLQYYETIKSGQLIHMWA